MSQLLQQHYDKSEYKRGGARRLMESGILRDYLNEKSNSQVSQEVQFEPSCIDWESSGALI